MLQVLWVTLLPHPLTCLLLASVVGVAGQQGVLGLQGSGLVIADLSLASNQGDAAQHSAGDQQSAGHLCFVEQCAGKQVWAEDVRWWEWWQGPRYMRCATHSTVTPDSVAGSPIRPETGVTLVPILLKWFHLSIQTLFAVEGGQEMPVQEHNPCRTLARN